MFKGNNDFRHSLNQTPKELDNNLDNVDTFLTAVPQVTPGFNSGVWLASSERFWHFLTSSSKRQTNQPFFKVRSFQSAYEDWGVYFA